MKDSAVIRRRDLMVLMGFNVPNLILLHNGFKIEKNSNFNIKILQRIICNKIVIGDVKSETNVRI